MENKVSEDPSVSQLDLRVLCHILVYCLTPAVLADPHEGKEGNQLWDRAPISIIRKVPFIPEL